MVDERVLAERLIRYDTSQRSELIAAAGFVRGWLESRRSTCTSMTITACRCSSRRSVPRAGRADVVFHGHLDVVPAGRSSLSLGSRVTG